LLQEKCSDVLPEDVNQQIHQEQTSHTIEESEEVDCWYDMSLDSDKDRSVEGSISASISTNSTIDKSSDVLDHAAFQTVIEEADDN